MELFRCEIGTTFYLFCANESTRWTRAASKKSALETSPLKNAASSPCINGYETSKDRGLCAGEISEGTIQGFRGAGSYEKLQVKKEGRSCAVFPWIGAVACRIRAEQEPTADLQIG